MKDQASAQILEVADLYSKPVFTSRQVAYLSAKGLKTCCTTGSLPRAYQCEGSCTNGEISVSSFHPRDAGRKEMMEKDATWRGVFVSSTSLCG